MRRIVPILIAALVGVLLIIAVRQIVSGDDEPGQQDAADDGSCSQFVVAASSEKAALLGDLADDWNGTDPSVDGTCVRAQVVSKASGGAAMALSAPAWDEAVEGPRPDVWTPASSSWAELTRQGRADQDLPDILPAEAPSLAQTPLVIAMPRPMAEALGWPDQQIGWSDLADLASGSTGWAAVGHPEWGAFKLGKTNPNYSTSGLNATIGAYFAATGVSSDLTIAQVQAPETQDFVRRIENSVVHYGDTTLTFLDNMSEAAEQGRGLTYVSAVTVEEKSVWDYNQGNPTGDPATLGDQPEPSIPLVAVYPEEGTLLSDNPWYVLEADWVDDTKAAAAQQFADFVRSDDAQRRFQDAGFRTFEGEPGDIITEENGFLPAGPSVTLAAPAPPVLQAVEESWEQLRKRARVLTVLDVSGSMSEAVPDSGGSRLELAVDAVAKSVEDYADDDNVGLWVFSTERGPAGEPWLSMVEVGPIATTRPQIQTAVSTLFPEGGTALYATIREAQEQMLASLDPGRINAIILLSDGRNEYPPDTDLDGLLDQLQGESPDVSIRVFTIGYGDDADTEALKAIAEASAGEYYDASDPASIDKVLTSVLSNF